MNFTAIFGGTFNPPHIGHQAMLDALESNANVKEIFVMPDRIPPHKVCDFLADDGDRIEMSRLMMKNSKKAELCLVEFERTGKSYTYDTVIELQKKFPHKNFAFVCGGDMLMSFETWYRYDELKELLPFIVFRRRDINDKDFDKQVERLKNKGMEIIVMEEKIPVVSSSFIRNGVDNIKKFVPLEVYKYIKSRGLYSVGK